MNLCPLCAKVRNYQMKFDTPICSTCHNVISADCLSHSRHDTAIWEYPLLLMPGAVPDENGELPEHTPYLGFGNGGVVAVRCGGATIKTSHQTFSNLFEWAQHVSGQEADTLRNVIIGIVVADYKREKGMK